VPNLSDVNARRAVESVLLNTYPQIDADQSDAILTHFFSRDADEVLAALNAHITDPDKGTWPPKPADLVRHLQGQAPAPESWKMPKLTGPMVTVQSPEWVKAETGTGTFEVSKSQCEHCGDEGLAWFYHDREPTGNRHKRRVWTDKEARELPAPAFNDLAVSRLAVCVCDAGKQFRNTSRFHVNRGNFTSLKRVYQLAEERRKWEGVESGEVGQP